MELTENVSTEEKYLRLDGKGGDRDYYYSIMRYIVREEVLTVKFDLDEGEYST